MLYSSPALLGGDDENSVVMERAVEGFFDALPCETAAAANTFCCISCDTVRERSDVDKRGDVLRPNDRDVRRELAVVLSDLRTVSSIFAKHFSRLLDDTNCSSSGGDGGSSTSGVLAGDSCVASARIVALLAILSRSGADELDDADPDDEPFITSLALPPVPPLSAPPLPPDCCCN